MSNWQRVGFLVSIFSKGCLSLGSSFQGRGPKEVVFYYCLDQGAQSLSGKYSHWTNHEPSRLLCFCKSTGSRCCLLIIDVNFEITV